MSKFNVHGSAEQSFPAEQLRLHLSVCAEDKDAGESIRKGSKSLEQLLQALSDTLQIKPEALRLENDRTGSGYGRESAYQRSVTVSVIIPADLAALHAITELLETQSDAEYHIDWLLNDRKTAEETVMRAAFADSRKKAEQLADMLGQKITGAEKVNYEFRGDDEPQENMRCAAYAAGAKRLADCLQLPEVRISKNVDITWLAE